MKTSPKNFLRVSKNILYLLNSGPNRNCHYSRKEDKIFVVTSGDKAVFTENLDRNKILITSPCNQEKKYTRVFIHVRCMVSRSVGYVLFWGWKEECDDGWLANSRKTVWQLVVRLEILDFFALSYVFGMVILKSNYYFRSISSI